MSDTRMDEQCHENRLNLGLTNFNELNSNQKSYLIKHPVIYQQLSTICIDAAMGNIDEILSIEFRKAAQVFDRIIDAIAFQFTYIYSKYNPGEESFADFFDITIRDILVKGNISPEVIELLNSDSVLERIIKALEDENPGTQIPEC